MTQRRPSAATGVQRSSSAGARQIAVVGAGRMGSEIAVEFAVHGFDVHVLVPRAERGQVTIDRTIQRAGDLGLLDEPPAIVRARLTIVAAVTELPRSLNLVVESVPEDADLKGRLLADIAIHAPAAILASNTSSLSITDLGRRAGAPERTVGLHYWNPPLLMPLVEISCGSDTDGVVLEAVREIVETAGKVAIMVRREVPGFIWNRLQMAILREALWLVENGVASTDDVDQAVQLGLARRWRQAGLFASVYLGGAAQWETIANNLFPNLSNATEARGLATLVLGMSDRWEGSRERRDLALAEDRGNGVPNEALARSARRLRT